MFRHYLVLLIAVLLLTVPGGCRKAGPGLNLPKVEWAPKAKKWMSPNPLVKVCSTAPVTVEEVQYALDIWATHGAPKLLAVPSYCHTMTDLHTVYVDVPSLGTSLADWSDHGICWAFATWCPDPQTVGLTSVYSVNAGGPAAGAYIHLLSDDMRILTHEVGHLWIQDHYPAGDHILTAYVDNYGDGWDGVDKAFR